MQIKDVLDKVPQSKYYYELKMSNYFLDFTVEHPDLAQSGYTYLSYPTETSFEIDWHGKGMTKVHDLLKYDKYNEFLSYDCDDGNEINFKSIIINDKLEVVILV